VNYSWQIDKKSLEIILNQIKRFEKKAQNKVLRRGASAWGRATTAALKAAVPINDKELRESITWKVKKLKKNRGLWCGVGFRSGRKIDTTWAGTKARWYNDGWTAFPKGRKTQRTGKGWRKGLRGANGRLVYQTRFVDKTAERMIPLFPKYITESLNQAIKEGI
jgi:hypothetical protein